jgi:hypothetical protein
MNGLHSCKPGNEPVVGQIKTFVVEQRTGKSGKAYTKITSKAADQGGQPYKILSAKPTGHTDSYGNISFNIEVEPANGAQPMGSGTSLPKNHDYFKPDNGSDRSSRIERQHSQEMAIRYWTLLGKGGVLSPEDCKDTQKLRAVIDWFQRDISHTPSAPTAQQPEPPPQSEPDNDEEIPF